MGKDYNRGQSGRFSAGNDGGPGRPKRVYEQATLDAILSKLSPDVVAEITQAMIERAKRGSTEAYRLLMGYAAGLPTQNISLESGDEPLEITLKLPGRPMNETPELPDSGPKLIE